MNIPLNVPRVACFAAIAIVLLFASMRSPAQTGPHHPHPPMRVPVPQPVAPSTLPYEAYRYGDDYPYVIDHERYEYDTRGPCIAQEASRETSESTGSSGESAPNAIDWCALAPYQPRYAPQIPASWWWHHRRPWHYGRNR